MTAPFRPIWLPPHSPVRFPDPRLAPAMGLVAGGGDLSPARLRAAYLAGIFPWYDEPPILWWSPDPRTIVTPESLHVSRSLKRHLRQCNAQQSLRIQVTHDIERVMRACGEREQGTWITEAMVNAYVTLGRAGDGVAYEVLRDDELVGGLYGVRLGGLFAAESMFHRDTDASKVALVTAVLHQFDSGTTLFDVQFLTSHLASMGAYEISRAEYLERLAAAEPQAARSPERSLPDLGLKAPADLLAWVVTQPIFR